MSVYDKLKELDITLPPVATPAAAYVPFVQTGNLVYLSGHIAKKDGKPWVGQAGKNMTTEEAKVAARAVAIDLMGTLHAAVGDLNKVKRIVKLVSLVNSTATSVTSGELGLSPIRTCETGPWPTVVARGTADDTLANSNTTRRPPTPTSRMAPGVNCPIPTMVTAVDCPTRETRTS